MDELFPFCCWGWQGSVKVVLISFFINVNVPGALARCLAFHKHRNKGEKEQLSSPTSRTNKVHLHSVSERKNNSRRSAGLLVLRVERS